MIGTAAYLFALCWVLAQVEIQIEGEHGWAEKLPTWRWSPPLLLRLTNGKPVTGYHVYLTLFLILFFHLPLLFVGFSRALESKIAAMYFLTTITWDFQWFVWNPAWGPRRFIRDKVWWFPVRVGWIPLEYIFGAASSFGVVALFWPGGLGWWLSLFAWILAASLLSAVLALILRPQRTS